eukprot:m.38306 g.38306  ORF g.38306 m.38306 type:complete len:189 (-) comp14621_c0_seq2:169-735(-)
MHSRWWRMKTVNLICIRLWNGIASCSTSMCSRINILPTRSTRYNVNAVTCVRVMEASATPDPTILWVSSMAGKMGMVNTAPYAACKHALHGYFESMRMELEHRGSKVSITSVVLGNIDTESNRKATEGLLPSYVHRHSAAKAATAVVDAAQARVREAFFPFFEMAPLLYLRPFFPGTIDSLVRVMMAA